MRLNRGILCLTAALIAPGGAALAHGGGSMGGGTSGSAGDDRASAPEDYEADAAKASNPEKSSKALGKAHDYYSKALEQFIDAVSQQPKMYQAWNYIGFANRHLGNYDAALSAYAKALEINPVYPEAIEYRGEAYLGLNKLDEAKQDYMSLFRASRPLADELMAAMHRWVDERRKDARGLDPSVVDAFGAWMDERAGIAAQTASLGIGA